MKNSKIMEEEKRQGKLLEENGRTQLLIMDCA